MKDLAIIIVSYNVCKFLEQTLVSVQKASREISVEVFVVDNQSVDGSAEMVRSRFPEVHLIANQENLGFSKANNQGIRLSNAKYILLLNPDTVLQEDTLSKCVQFMNQTPNAGALGVKMVDGAGKFLPESKRSLPTPWIAFCKIFGLSYFFPRSKTFGRYHLGYLSENETHPIEVLAGAFMMLRKEAVDQVGLLDEDFFMYGEDIDLSYRILKADYKNYYFPETRIIHYKGESTKKTSVNYVFIFYNAMIIFYRKHFMGKNVGLFSTLIKAAIYIRAFVAISRRFFEKISMPILDFGLIYTGIWSISHWGLSLGLQIPAYFFDQVIPFQILFWQSTLYFLGGYDKPYRVSSLLIGTLMGSLIISAISNFVEPIRYTKEVLILASVLVFVVSLTNRLLNHFLSYGNIYLHRAREKRLLIVGNANESQRVIDIIQHAGVDATILGYLSSEPENIKNQNYLGNAAHLADIVSLYKANEVIFCAKNLSANRIIEHMTSIDGSLVEYKIVPDNSNFIIGSHSKNTQGDFYSINVQLKITKEENVKAKRIADLVLSACFFVVSPVLVWFMQHKTKFFKNLKDVFTGERSWVGYGGKDLANLPKIKPGVLSLAQVKARKDEDQKLKQFDMQYAKNYSLFTDLFVVFASISKLGN